MTNVDFMRRIFPMNFVIIYSGFAPIEVQSVTGKCRAHMQVLLMRGFCAHWRLVAAS